MQELKRLPPKKTWRLARNKVTGRIYTDANSHVYCGDPVKQQEAIDYAKQRRLSTGELTPEGSANAHTRVYDTILRKYVYTNYTGPCLSDVELFDYIPVLRMSLRFKNIYNGTSGASIIFADANGVRMVLRTVHTDKFFELVGMGKIQMDTQGFYTFDVHFTKGGDKVYMELYGYDD